MNAKSAHKKGRRLITYLVPLLKERLDKNTYEVSGSGAGLTKGDLYIPSLDIVGEAKNAEVVHLTTDFKQAERQAINHQIPALFIRNPARPEFEQVFVVLDLGDFIDLTIGQKGEVNVISNKSSNLKWAVRNLIEAGKKVNRILENEQT